MLGFLVAVIKLSGFVQVTSEPGCWGMAVLMALITIINKQDMNPLWQCAPGKRDGGPPPGMADTISWNRDFVADNLFNGRRFRALTVVDRFSRDSQQPVDLAGRPNPVCHGKAGL